MVTATDVTEQHSTSAVYLAGDIHKQTTCRGLVPPSAGRVKRLAAQPRAGGRQRLQHRPHHHRRHRRHHLRACCTLAEAKLGPAPVDYAWVAAGSQARSEQTAKSDQDNCLILDDDYDEARTATTSSALADLRQRRAGRLRLHTARAK
jgi:CBS domain-containing protein